MPAASPPRSGAAPPAPHAQARHRTLPALPPPPAGERRKGDSRLTAPHGRGTSPQQPSRSSSPLPGSSNPAAHGAAAPKPRYNQYNPPGGKEARTHTRYSLPQGTGTTGLEAAAPLRGERHPAAPRLPGPPRLAEPGSRATRLGPPA